MKKALCFIMAVCVICSVFAEDNGGGYTLPEKKNNFAWIKGFFIDFNLLYDYAKIKPEPDFMPHSLLLEPALGYDFGRAAFRLYGDFGFLLAGDVIWSNGAESISKGMDMKMNKFGLEASFKPIKSTNFDLLIPFGVIFNWTEFTRKNPSYIQDGSGTSVLYDRKWMYEYTSLASGLTAKINIGNNFSIIIPASISLVVKKEYTYSETLRGDYVWTGTNSAVWNEKYDVDIFEFSLGIGIRGHL